MMSPENSTEIIPSGSIITTDMALSTSNVTSIAAGTEVYPHTSRLIYLVGYPIVMAIGFLGNMCSLLVTTRPQFRKRSTYCYLSVLAVADTFVLLILGTAYIIMMATDSRELLLSAVFCTLVYFLYYQSTHLASWLLVAITIDRYIYIHCPLLRATLCTVRRAQQVCVAIAVLSVLVNVHQFGTEILVDTGEIKYCAARPGSEKFLYEVWPILDAVLYAYLPSICITIVNLFTIRHLWSTRSLPSNQYGQLIIKARRTTIMLVNMTSLFVITTVIGVTTMLLKYSSEEVIITPIVAVWDLIIYTNHACNFYIYYAFAKEIRVAFKWVIYRTQRIFPFFEPQIPIAVPNVAVIQMQGI